jgi:hypothetical protein
MKRTKQQVETFLNTTEQCKLLAELVQQKETKSKVLLCLIANRQHPNEMAILFFERVRDEIDLDGILNVMSFHVLRKDDFGLKIIGELQFDLFFKENTALYSLEATSVGTMWSVINALTTAIKIVNSNNGGQDDETDHFDVENYAWADYYKKYTEVSDDLSSSTAGLLSTSSTLVSVPKTKETPKKDETKGSIKEKFLTCFRG